MKVKGERWRLALDGDLVSLFLYVVSGHIVYRLYKEENLALVALKANGELAWEREFEQRDLRLFFPYGNDIYTDGVLARRLSATTGETLAERGFDSKVRIFPPSGDTIAYFRKEPPAFLGLDKEDLGVAWEWPDSTEEYEPHDRQVCLYQIDGKMRLVNPVTSKVIRSVQGPPRPSLAGIHTHCGDLWCQFYLRDPERLGIDTASGKVVWRGENKAGHGLPVFEEEVAYTGPDGLRAIDSKTGEELWHQSFEVPARTLSCRPAVLDDRIYVGTIDGGVYALGLHTGEILFERHLDFKPKPVRPIDSNTIVVGGINEIVCLETEGG